MSAAAAASASRGKGGRLGRHKGSQATTGSLGTSQSKGASDPYAARRQLYSAIERMRQSRVVAYVTGDRPGMETQISSEAVDLFGDHLDEIFPAKKISLMLYTRGGDTLAAWSLVNMLRMFCDELEILVPNKARSAGTLMCLGADRILMSKQATLGPIDPSVNGLLNPQVPGAGPHARAPVSVEAVKGYIEMARTDFGIKDGAEMATVLTNLAEKVHPLVLGAIFRSRGQIRFLAGQLLDAQLKKNGAAKKKIVDFLCSESGSHDYTINRREADALGLQIEKPSSALYDLLKAWMESVRDELELQSPFDPNALLGTAQSVSYRAVRCLIESTASNAHPMIFVSEGHLERTASGQVAPGVPQMALSDRRTFEGWRRR